MSSMQDQVVLVTGANGGIGASVLSAYAESGATVIGSDRGGRRLEVGAGYYDLDVTDEAATTQVIADIVSAQFAEGVGEDAAGASQARKERAAQLPMQRFARPDEVSNAALFLTHPQNRYITGVSLDVAGGAHLGMGS